MRKKIRCKRSSGRNRVSPTRSPGYFHQKVSGYFYLGVNAKWAKKAFDPDQMSFRPPEISPTFGKWVIALYLDKTTFLFRMICTYLIYFDFIFGMKWYIFLINYNEISFLHNFSIIFTRYAQYFSFNSYVSY